MLLAFLLFALPNSLLTLFFSVSAAVFSPALSRSSAALVRAGLLELVGIMTQSKCQDYNLCTRKIEILGEGSIRNLFATYLLDTNVTLLTTTDLMLPLPELSLDMVVALASCSGSQSSKVPSFLWASPCRRYCRPWARPRLLVQFRRLLPLLVLLLLDLLKLLMKLIISWDIPCQTFIIPEISGIILWETGVARGVSPRAAPLGKGVLGD